jgi:membrane fusion protein, multidrug efflux system
MKFPILLATALSLAPILVPTLAQADGTEAPPSVLVTTVPAQQGALPQTLTAYGAVEPAPDGSASISLLRAGQVTKLSVAPGGAVRKGDTLLVFGADPATVAAYDQATTTLAAAKQDRARTAELLGQQLATKAQLAQADKAVADAQGALDALNLSGGGKPVETVRAPFDGIVMSIAVGPGDRVQPSTPLMQLAKADQWVLAAGIEPAERGKVMPGAPVHLDPLDGSGDPVDGTVASVAGMIDPKTRLVEALVRLPADTLPGQGFRAKIEIGSFKGWLVPREAVLMDDGGGAHLFQVANGKAKSVAVKIVGSEDETLVVDGPLDGGKPIVASGSYQVNDGGAVRLDDHPVGAKP